MSTVGAPTVDLLERLAGGLRGIYACRVEWPEGEAVPERVRVLCDPERRTAAMRDVATAWFAVFGLRVPPDRFVVTAVRSLTDEPMPQRLQFIRFSFDHAGQLAEARVVLRLGDATFTGSAADAGETGRLRLAALATLAAVEAAAPHAPRCTLDDVGESVVGGRACVLAVVSGGAQRVGSLPLLGASFAGHEDAGVAAVRAVLAAVNRQLERFL